MKIAAQFPLKFLNDPNRKYGEMDSRPFPHILREFNESCRHSDAATDPEAAVRMRGARHLDQNVLPEVPDHVCRVGDALVDELDLALDRRLVLDTVSIAPDTVVGGACEDFEVFLTTLLQNAHDVQPFFHSDPVHIQFVLSNRLCTHIHRPNDSRSDDMC